MTFKEKNQIIDVLKVVRNAEVAVGSDWAIISDDLFDAYKIVVSPIGLLRSSSVPADETYEYLNFKDIRVYPQRAHYPGPRRTS